MDSVFKIALVLQGVDYLTGPLRKVTETVKGVTAHVERLSRASERLHNVGKSLQAVGKGVALGGVGGAALFGLDQVPFAALTAEHRLRALGNVGGLANPQLLQMRGQLLEISRLTNQMQDDLLSGVEVLVAAGMDVQEALNLQPVIGKTSTATQASVEDLAKTGFAMRDNLKVAAQEMQWAIDVLNQSGKEGRFELKNMAQFFPAITAGAASLGMKGVPAVASLGAALQVAMKGAGDPSQAANNLVNFLAKITAPETVRNFEQFGVDIQYELRRALTPGKDTLFELVNLIHQVTGGDRFVVSQIFGDLQVMSFLNPMLQNMQEYQRIRKEALAAQGVTERDFQQMMDTTLEQWQKLKINLATIAMPLLFKPIEKLNAWLEAANQHSTLLTATVYGIGGAIIGGGALFALGTIVTMVAKGLSGVATLVQGVSWLISTGPMLAHGWQIAVAWVRRQAFEVSRLIGWQRLLAAIDYRGGFWNAFQYWLMIGRYRMLELIATSRAWIATNLLTSAGLKGLAAATWAWTTALLANPWTWVAVAVMGVALLIWKFWQPIANFFVGFWRGLREGAAEFAPAFAPLLPLVRGLGTALAWVLTPFRWLWNLLTRLVTPVEGLGSAGESLGVRWGRGVMRMLAALGGLPAKMLAAGAQMVDSLWQGIQEGFGALYAQLHGPLEKLLGFWPRSPAKEGPLRDLHRIRLVETIAETVRPAPLVDALSRTAAAAALTVPLTVTPALAALPALAVPPAVQQVHQQLEPLRAAPALTAPLTVPPALTRRAGAGPTGAPGLATASLVQTVSSVTRTVERARGGPADGAGAGPITIHYAPQITLGPGAAAAGAGAVREALQSQLRQDADALLRLIEAAQRRRDRTKY